MLNVLIRAFSRRGSLAAWLLLACIAFLALGYLSVYQWLASLMLYVSLHLMRFGKQRWLVFYWVAAVVSALGFVLWAPDPDALILLLEGVVLRPLDNPLTLTLNLPKMLGGLFILIYFADKQFFVWRYPLASLFCIVLSVILLLGLALVSGASTWSVKWSYAVMQLLAANLLLTVIAEEVFFRLLLQWRVYRLGRSLLLPPCFAHIVAIIATAFLFAITHGVDWSAMSLLIVLAGLIYALVFALTRSVWWSIAVHFFTNAAHIVLLDYPGF